MCNPECHTKSDEELARAVRNHNKAYEAARSELMRRGWNVSIRSDGDVQMYRTKRETL